MEEEFATDSHLYWPKPDEQRRQPNETQNNWQQISEQMELDLDTFAQEEDETSGDLMDWRRPTMY